MPDYRPIPGQEATDMGPPFSSSPVDDLTMMARERASNILMPYASMGGASPNGAPLGPSLNNSPIPGKTPVNPPGAVPNTSSTGIEDKLYQSVHPDTLSMVLETIMQLVTGKPIPRDRGGPVDPDKEYIVGEEGPERFRPAVPGQIIPEEKKVPSFGERARELFFDPYANIGKSIYRGYQEHIGEPFARSMEPIESDIRYLATGERPEMVQQGARIPPYTGPRPWRNRPQAGPVDMVQTKTGAYEIPEAGWKDYGEGIRYKLGPEDKRGDEIARQRITELTSPGGAYIPGIGRYEGIPPTERSYYDVHPEEKAIDEAAMVNAPPMGMAEYERNVTRMRMTPAERLQQDKYEAEQRKQYTAEAGATERAKMEYGPGSPLSQERLAHAEALRTAPSEQMEVEREKSRAHLQGIQTQVAGHLEAARIGAETKDPMMKEIGALLTQGMKNAEMYGVPFNPQETISGALSVYRALGAITDEQWNKLPKEYRPPVQGAKLAPDGNWYIPDPKRPGKYLRVD